MKRVLFFLFVLTLAVPAFAPTVKAQTTSNNENVKPVLTPFNLASLAYRGQFRDNGVPGYGSLEAGVNSGAVTAEDVIQAAINDGRLAASTQQDDEYTVNLQHHLDRLVERDTR